MTIASLATWPYPDVELLRRDIVYFYDIQSQYVTIEADIDWSLLTMR